MSRSNPVDTSPNPAVRWFVWDGANGVLKYWDRDAVDPKTKEKTGANITVGTGKDGFQFMLLDETSTVKGWNDLAKAGMWSNEVRDTRTEPLTVKLFDERRTMVARGLYQEIKDRVVAAGGHFTTTCYIAFKPGDALLAIAGLQFKGAALSAWMEFKKHNRKAIYEGAIRVKGFTEGKKGAIVFRTPKFQIVNVKPETNAQALDLDKQLQEYLKGYFERQVKFQPQQSAAAPGETPQANGNPEAPPQGDGPQEGEPPPNIDPNTGEPVDEDIPF